ncbi:MAG TPA: hypothetical protein VF115_04125 [Acidimicrobiia bacterium]
MKDPIEYVETLARGLDADDYEMVASVLSDQVEYSIGSEVIHGPAAVLTSYREASEMAHGLFDMVVYDHEVKATDNHDIFRVSYSDELTVAGETLKHLAEQHVTVVPGDGVVRIVNVDLPGEREKVNEFMARHGLSRD